MKLLLILDEKVKGQKYICHSLYFTCEVTDRIGDTNMTEEELNRGYQLDWAELHEIISTNKSMEKEDDPERDTVFLKWYSRQNERTN